MTFVWSTQRKPSTMSAIGELPWRARSAVHMHQHQTDDDGDVADGIGGKAPAFADFRHQNSGDGGADDARTVEHRGIQGDGVHQIFFADHVNEEGLASGNIEGVDDSEQGREHKDVPDLDASGQRKDSQNAGENHGGGLSGDDEPLRLAVAELVSVTVTRTENGLPLLVEGVPVILPEEEPMLRPGGKPEADQV